MTFKRTRIDIPSALALALIGAWILAVPVGLGLPNGWTITSHGTPPENDYLGLYSAGQLANRDGAAAPYDVERIKVEQRAIDMNPAGPLYPWAYPPTFLIVASLLALLPYSASMLVWSLSTFAAFVAAIARISTSRRDLLLMIATPAPWLNLSVGQNGALTAALMGFGLALLETRPIAAGIAIGLLSFKPHLGLLIPVALLAGGYYRTFAAAAVTTVMLAALSIAVFGIGPWLALPGELSHTATLLQTASVTQKIQSLFGLSRALGVSASHALWLQAGLTLSLIATTGWIWSCRNISFNLKAAILAAAATLATPYEFAYDLVILTVAQAFLLRHFSGRDVPRTVTYPLILANGLVLMFANLSPVPLGEFGSLIVLGLILREIADEVASSRGLATAGKIVPAA